jgi:hypothetical protein
MTDVKKKKRKSKKHKSKATLQKVASTGTKKAKEAAKFIYDNRQKIKDAAELVIMVMGAASQILGKPSKKPRKNSSRARSD